MPASPQQKPVYIAIKGTALALDRATGEILWETELKGSGFVNLVLNGSELLATTDGEIFCLDPATGRLRWHNPLRGYGYGIVTVATAIPQIAAGVEEMDRCAAATAEAHRHNPGNMEP